MLDFPVTLRTRRPEVGPALDALARLADSEDLEALQVGRQRGSSWLATQLGGDAEP